MTKLGLTLISALVGIALVLGGTWWVVEKNYTYQGVLIDPPAAAPEISLTDQNGDAFKLSEQRGRAALIFFGYTNCPDVCPITMAQFKQIKALLGDRASQVEFIFITVDPHRDTPERIRQYLANFDPNFIGLTGSDEALNHVWQAYGVYEEHQDTHGSESYLVDHSSRVYAIDQQGKWMLNYPFGMEAEKIALDMKHILKLETALK